jgi:hypothetical protein
MLPVMIVLGEIYSCLNRTPVSDTPAELMKNVLCRNHSENSDALGGMKAFPRHWASPKWDSDVLPIRKITHFQLTQSVFS